jgi:hypothetical protein
MIIGFNYDAIGERLCEKEANFRTGLMNKLVKMLGLTATDSLFLVCNAFAELF